MYICKVVIVGGRMEKKERERKRNLYLLYASIKNANADAMKTGKSTQCRLIFSYGRTRSTSDD